jgi:hypothetical protein
MGGGVVWMRECCLLSKKDEEGEEGEENAVDQV